MKIYLATTAPGNEQQRPRGMLDVQRRLLSYFHVLHNMFECADVFGVIVKEKRGKNA